MRGTYSRKKGRGPKVDWSLRRCLRKLFSGNTCLPLVIKILQLQSIPRL